MADAYEMYSYYKRKYNNASSQKSTSERKEEEYRTSKSRAESDLKDSKKEKLNLEKRLEGVRKIIAMMEGTGGLLSKNIPDKIQKSNKSSDESGVNFKGCIKCTGVASADVAQKFHSDKVHENVHSSNALTAFETEERRLVNAIAEIERQINQLNSKIETLKTQINRCNNEQSELKRSMNQYSSEMRYYKNRMND